MASLSWGDLMKQAQPPVRGQRITVTISDEYDEWQRKKEAAAAAEEKLIRQMLKTRRGQEAYLRGMTPQEWADRDFQNKTAKVFGPVGTRKPKAQFREQLMRGKRR